MAPNYKHVTHVIFDMDGLLLNTEDLYTHVYQSLCKPHGKTYDWNVKLPIMGMKPLIAAQYVIDTLKLPVTVEEWDVKVKLEMQKWFPSAILLPGAEKLVRHLHTNSIPIAVCTGSGTTAFNLKTTNHKEFFSLFHHIVLCGDDPEVEHGKPHPDAYAITKSRFDPSPDPVKVLVFEDAPNGVKSAIAAGMQVVMVPDENVPKSCCGNATTVLRSLQDFVPDEFGLPPYT